MEKYLRWNTFKNQVTAFTTTKEIGNVAFQVSNDHDGVVRARAIILNDLGIPSSHLVFVHQSHSDRINKVDESYFGMGENDFLSGPDCDALYTNKPNIALGVFHADCVPIFFYIQSHHIVGIIHAGYKGTLKNICEKSIKTVIENENIDPKDIKFYIGPSLSFKYYDLNEEDVKYIEELGYKNCLFKHDSKIGVDVKQININQLLSLGVPIENIEISDKDTGDDDNLFSAYKNHPIGRMASIIMLNK